VACRGLSHSSGASPQGVPFGPQRAHTVRDDTVRRNAALKSAWCCSGGLIEGRQGVQLPNVVRLMDLSNAIRLAGEGLDA